MTRVLMTVWLLSISLMDLNLNIDLDALANERFVPLFTNQARHLHMYGSAGSGKSHFAARKLLVRTLQGFKTGIQHRFVCLCKTEPEVRRSVFTLLADLRNGFGGLDKLMQPLGSMLAFRFVNGATIHCTGLDKPEKLKSIERPTGFWLEEATRFTREDRSQVNLRMRGDLGTYKQTMYTYNPDTVACTLYKDHHKQLENQYTGNGSGRDANRYFHHSTWRDNRWLDEEYIEELRGIKDLDKDYWSVYSEGLWGSRRHLIYQGTYRIGDASEWMAPADETIHGLDFGFNNPSALVEVSFRDGIPFVRQRIYERKLTNTALIAKLDDEEVDKRETIFADSAEPARIEEISQAGYDIRPATNAKKPNAVRARIDHVRRSHMVIHPDSTDLIDELETYKWKLDKEEEPLDEPVKFMDHACNALEYALFEHAATVMPGAFSV